MKKHFYLIIVLLVLNLVLCFGLIYISRKFNRYAHNHRIAIARIEDLKRQKKEQWYNYMNINEDTILSELSNLGFGEYIASPLNRLAVFITPSFCGSCLDSVCESLADMQKELTYPIVIMVPGFKYRDIQARFSVFPSVVTVEYDYELLSEDCIANSDKIILFRMGNEKIVNIIITDKESPEWIRDYLLQ